MPPTQEQQREELIAACEAALGCTLQAPQPQADSAGAAAAGAARESASSPGSGSEIRCSGGPLQRRRLIIFNLFALEGFHIAEALGVPCLAASPCLPPYVPPGGFKRRFESAHPQLFSRLQEAEGGWGGWLAGREVAPAGGQLAVQRCRGCDFEKPYVWPHSAAHILLPPGLPALPGGSVSWRDVEHWLWPLFTERWGGWRYHRLGLPAVPYSGCPPAPLPPPPPLLYGGSRVCWLALGSTGEDPS